MSTRMTIGNQPIVLDNLTHNYDFTDYVSGATVNDMVTTTQSGSLSNTPDHNKIGWIELDGVNQHLSLSNDHKLGDVGPSMTIEMGFRIPTGTSNTVWLMTTNGGSVDIESQSTSHTYALARKADGKLTTQAYISSNFSNTRVRNSTLTVANNVWYHMSILIYDRSSSDDHIGYNVKLNNVNYIDEHFSSSGVSTPYKFYNANKILVIGRDGRSGSNYYPLEVAYWRRYSSELTDKQRTQNYNHHVGRFGGQRY